MDLRSPYKYGRCKHLDMSKGVESGRMDVINAGLWALAGFDPALQHFAELREHLVDHPEDAPLRVSLDRALGVYLQAQTIQLFQDSGYSRESLDRLILAKCGASDVSIVIRDAASLTDDLLILDISGYAMYLTALTNWGVAPWNRFANTVNGLWHEKQKELAPA